MMMKFCKKCLIEKEVICFNKQSKAKDGLHSWCKDCECLEKAKYYKQNKDKILDRVKDWETNNKEKVLRHKQKWRQNNADKHRDNNKRWYHDNFDMVRDRILQKKFGITSAEYSELLSKQLGVCAICGQSSKDKLLAVDHCHATGTVRGLLCNLCNRGLGMFKDSPRLLTCALSYLTSRK
jgi:hypothetical protein